MRETLEYSSDVWHQVALSGKKNMYMDHRLHVCQDRVTHTTICQLGDYCQNKCQVA